MRSKITERKLVESLDQKKARTIKYKKTLLGLSEQTFENLEDSFRAITQAAANALDIERVSIWTINANTIRCRSLFLLWTAEYQNEATLQLTNSSAYLAALRHHKTIRADDARNDARTRELNSALLLPKDIHSVLDVPIWSSGQVVAVLRCEHTVTPRQWHDEDEDFANQLAMLIRLAIEVAEHRRAEEAAEQANLAKSAFLSNMSHELRTPLNAILGFAQLLANSKDSPLNGQQRERVQHIIQGGEHLLELINEILDLAKIESGKLSLSVETVLTRNLLDDTLILAGAMTSKYEVSLLDRTSSELPNLRVDYLRTKQVLLNLLSNAMKYNYKGGTVWLDADLLRDHAMRLRISDTGCGIPLEKHGDLFHPFTRLGVETQAIEGTGIGLVLTKALVEQMGGRVGFESTEGGGSSFWVDLPLTDENDVPARSLQQQTAAAFDIGSLDRLLLYVEDNPENLALMEAIVREIPHLNLLTAPTAELGLALAEQHRPDLIILDINLPGMSGWEALEHLGRNDHTRDIPVFVLSADATPGAIARGREFGLQRYLTKPINVDQMVKAICEHLSKKEQ